MDTLGSERLLLRMFRESDLDAYAEMCGDPEVMRYLGDGVHFNPRRSVAEHGGCAGPLATARLRALGGRGAGNRPTGWSGGVLETRRLAGF